MSKLKRKIKSKYYTIRFFLGSLVCKVFGHKENLGFGSSFERFSLIKICPRCGKVLEVISTPVI